MKIYLAGKISGVLPENCEVNFDNAEMVLRKKYGNDIEVFNPYTAFIGMSAKAAMKQCLIELCTNKYDAIALQDNWHTSKGCQIEYILCEYLGMEIIYL